MENNETKDIQRLISLVEAASRRLDHSIKDLHKIRTSSSSLFSKVHPASYVPEVEMTFKKEIPE